MYYSSVSAAPSVVSQKHGIHITHGFRHCGVFFNWRIVVSADFRMDNILSFKCVLMGLCFEDPF